MATTGSQAARRCANALPTGAYTWATGRGTAPRTPAGTTGTARRLERKPLGLNNRFDRNAPKDGKVYNGYARIPKDSSLFRLIAEKRVEDVIGSDITYVGEDGWIGFDTGHACDVWPLLPEYYATQAAKIRAMGEQPYVRTVGKVIEEVERLCERIVLAQRTAEALG